MPVHVVRRRRCEEHHRSGEIVRRAPASGRDAAQDFIAALRVFVAGTLPPKLVMEVAGTLFEPRPSMQSVGVFFDSRPVCTLTLMTAAGRDPARWRCEFSPAGDGRLEHEVRFVIAKPTSPSDFDAGGDDRKLGFRLTSLRLSDASTEAPVP